MMSIIHFITFTLSLPDIIHSKTSVSNIVPGKRNELSFETALNHLKADSPQPFPLFLAATITASLFSGPRPLFRFADHQHKFCQLRLYPKIFLVYPGFGSYRVYGATPSKKNVTCKPKECFGSKGINTCMIRRG